MLKWFRDTLDEKDGSVDGEAFKAFKSIAKSKVPTVLNGHHIDPIMATAVVKTHSLMKPDYAKILSNMPVSILSQWGNSLVRGKFFK